MGGARSVSGVEQAVAVRSWGLRTQLADEASGAILTSPLSAVSTKTLAHKLTRSVCSCFPNSDCPSFLVINQLLFLSKTVKLLAARMALQLAKLPFAQLYV